MFVEWWMNEWMNDSALWEKREQVSSFFHGISYQIFWYSKTTFSLVFRFHTLRSFNYPSCDVILPRHPDWPVLICHCPLIKIWSWEVNANPQVNSGLKKGFQGLLVWLLFNSVSPGYFRNHLTLMTQIVLIVNWNPEIFPIRSIFKPYLLLQEKKIFLNMSPLWDIWFTSFRLKCRVILLTLWNLNLFSWTRCYSLLRPC